MTIEEAIKTIELAVAEAQQEYRMDFAAAFDVAISALRAQQEKPSEGWISVKDKFPEVGDWNKNVLTISDVGQFRVAYYDGYCWRDLQKQCIGLLAPFTHWMPLPDPPKEM